MSIFQRRLKPSDLNLNSHPVVPFSDGSNQKSGFQVFFIPLQARKNWSSARFQDSSSSSHPVTRILARLPRCMGMLAKILARSCQDLTKATMIMQDHGKADHASYQAYQDFPCILPSFSMCLAKHTKIFLSILPIQPGFFHAFFSN